MLLYLSGIMSTALISGFVVNKLVTIWHIDLSQYFSNSHDHVSYVLQLIALILLFTMSTRKFLMPKKYFT
jgi:hypothetical protein